MKEDPTFCPTCGSRMRRSLAERLGIDGDALWSILIAITVFLAIATLVTVITYGVVVGYQNSNEHEAEMMRGGYIQQTRIITPATDRCRAATVTEWVKEPIKEK